jgi:seryl-tRNA synthetase
VNDDVKVPAYKRESDQEEWRTFLYNQERMINQQEELLEMQKKLVEAMEKVASPERVKGVEQGQMKMIEAVNLLSLKIEKANDQLEVAVTKLASTFWGLMKVPVAVVVVGVASWAFLYTEKISQNVWLIMLGVAVFPWLGDSITAIGKIIRGRNDGGSPHE